MPVAPGLTKRKRDPIPQAMLDVMLELLAVGVFTLLAGAGNDIGTIMVILMVGFWMVFLITNSAIITRLEKALEVA